MIVRFLPQDFVLTVKINSGNYRADLRVVLKDDDRSVNGNARKDKSCQSKRGKVGYWQSLLWRDSALKYEALKWGSRGNIAVSESLKTSKRFNS